MKKLKTFQFQIQEFPDRVEIGEKFKFIDSPCLILSISLYINVTMSKHIYLKKFLYESRATMNEPLNILHNSNFYLLFFTTG